jgi:branched-chain amino acid transport system permease protein
LAVSVRVVLSGLGSGALLALTGIAFVLIYKATKV